MGTNFAQLFGNIRTPEDYRRAREQFELNKQLKRGQLDVQRAKIEQAQAEAANPMGNAPAALQINSAIQDSLNKAKELEQAGNPEGAKQYYDTANRIAWLTRSQAYGVDTFGPQGNTPETFKPFKPQAPAETQSQAQGEYVPTGQSIMPSGGSSIAQQLAAKAGMEAGAKERSKLEQQRLLKPQIEAGVMDAKGLAERRQGYTKAQSALKSFQQQADIVVDNVDKALELADSGWATGYGSLLSPLPNTEARKLRNYLDTIKANVGFDKLQQMRDNSPTGGALGQVSEMENRLLQAVNGALDPAQADQLKENLQVIRKLYPAVMEERNRAFEQDFGMLSPLGGNPVTVPQKSGARREMEEMQGKFKKPSGRLVYNPATNEFE